MITKEEKMAILKEAQALINKAILEHEKDRHEDLDIPEEGLGKA